ncbi:hypothetical protein Pelo_7452 [Pelomyxa schiedti]|nr:hypothetical protein Pelo_7452 [Pelomyxa schiedti]
MFLRLPITLLACNCSLLLSLILFSKTQFYIAHGQVTEAHICVSCSCLFSHRVQQWSSYRWCELCLLCFDINSPDSLLQIANNTFPALKLAEMTHRKPKAYILVGLQRDLSSNSSIPPATCRRYAEDFGADSYIEVSALKKINIELLVSHIQESLYNIHEKRQGPDTVLNLDFDGAAQTSLLGPRVIGQIVEQKPVQQKPTQSSGLFGFLSSLLPSASPQPPAPQIPSTVITVKPCIPIEGPRCIPLFGDKSSNPDFLCFGHVCHHFDGNLFLFGGRSTSSRHCVERFDIKLKQWLTPIECVRKPMENNVGGHEIAHAEFPVQVDQPPATSQQEVTTVCEPLGEALAGPPGLSTTPTTQQPTWAAIREYESSQWMPSCFPASCNFRTAVYLFGGTVNDDTNDFFQFDMATLQWTSLNTSCTTAIPPAKHGASLVYFRGILYLFGGNSFISGACNTLHGM